MGFLNGGDPLPGQASVPAVPAESFDACYRLALVLRDLESITDNAAVLGELRGRRIALEDELADELVRRLP